MTDATQAPAEGAYPAGDQVDAEGHDPTSDLIERLDAVDRAADEATIAARGDRYMTADQLAILSDQVSMADTWRATEQARAEHPDDPDLAKRKAGMLVFMYVAQRIGVAPADVTFDGFLATIRQDDFVELMTGKRREGK